MTGKLLYRSFCLKSVYLCWYHALGPDPLPIGQFPLSPDEIMFIKAYKRQLDQLVENQGEDYDIADQSSLIISNGLGHSTSPPTANKRLTVRKNYMKYASSGPSGCQIFQSSFH